MTCIDDVSLGYWLADYYALATIVLLAVCAALARLRQPARRLSVSWSALGGLAALMILSALPSWPRAGWLSRPGPATTSRTLLGSSTVSGPTGSPLPRPTRPAAVQPGSRTEASSIEGGRPLKVATRDQRGTLTEARMGDWPPFAPRAFLAGGALVLAWLGVGSWQTASLRRRARQAPGWSKDVLARIVGDGTAAPTLLTCDRLQQPVAVGLLRPTVILPDRFLEDEPGPRLEAVLEHEWAHIRNRDLWLIALSRLLMPILFAHPAYWWLRRRIRDDQEILADAHAAKVDGRLEYAEVLLSWASGASERSWAAIGGSLALWECPSRLKRRITMLLDRDFRVEATCPRRWRIGVRGGMALAVLALSFLTVRPAPAVADLPAGDDGPATATKVGTAPKADETAKVVDPDGKPVAGAEVYVSETVYHSVRQPKPAVLLTKTDADGSFPLPPLEPSPTRTRVVVAMAEGFGPAIMNPPTAQAEKVLRLSKDDVPINGRVLDIQGSPVAGATVQLVGILRHPSGRLDAWLEAVEAERSAFQVEYRLLKSWTGDDLPSFFPPLTTDRQGRFTLKGVGRERIASLLISGPGIETRFEYVATRSMPTLKFPAFERRDMSKEVVYHGANFDLIAGPCLEATGTVTDKDTGKPLAGVTVMTAALFGNPLRTLSTSTDDRGRYRLTGIPPKTPFNDDQDLLARTDGDVPYLPTTKHVGGGGGGNPITIDFALKRGVRARGRVVDKTTGKGVRAQLSYYILESNPYLKTYPRYGTIRAAMPNTTDDEGAFELVVMPGQGVIGARAGNEHYRLGIGSEKIKGVDLENAGMVLIPALPHHLIPTNYNTVALIDPKEGDESFASEIALDRGRTVKGKVVGPDGEPLAGTRIEGLQDHFRIWSHEPLPTAEFVVEGIGPVATRDLLVSHEGKKLAGAYVIGTDEAGPITVRLEASGTVTGRLVDQGGVPLAEAELSCYVPMKETTHRSGSLPTAVKTGKDGRFRAEGLVPGRAYSFHAWRGDMSTELAEARGIVVTRGETRDLGDVTLRPSK